LKAGALAIAATVAAFVAVKNPLTVFANATASLIGISDVRSAPAPVAPSRQAMAAVSASVPAVATNPTLPPSRDEIALALKTAHQVQAPAEIQQPAIAAAPVVAGPPVRRLDADELATLMTRAKALLAAGDIPSARLLLERAAEAQEASAALMLAQTYDPTVLGAQDIRNITPDPALARNWYQRAAQFGSADAQRRLSQLQ
jgi:TPR repeat protein